MSAIDADNFWNYSLSLYSKPNVAKHCIHLQDEWGCNVNMFLFCCWLTSQNIMLSDATLSKIVDELAPQNEQLKLFRIQRLGAKLASPETYEDFKRRELAMERIQQGLIVKYYNEAVSESNRELASKDHSKSSDPILCFIAYYGLNKRHVGDWITPLISLI